MEAFQMQDDGKRIYFRNLNRIPPGEELADVLKQLQVAGCQVGSCKAAGLEDIYQCRLDEREFDLLFTGEEAFLYVPNEEDAEHTMAIFD